MLKNSYRKMDQGEKKCKCGMQRVNHHSNFILTTARRDLQRVPACKGSKLCRDKDKQLGYEGADSPVAEELHLNRQEEVSGLWDWPL